MSKSVVEVVDAAGITRRVRGVDAREIEAIVQGERQPDISVAEEVAEEKVDIGFPADFPGQSAFDKEGIGYHQALRMSKDELLEVKGIGPKVADEILKLRGAQ